MAKNTRGKANELEVISTAEGISLFRSISSIDHSIKSYSAKVSSSHLSESPRNREGTREVEVISTYTGSTIPELVENMIAFKVLILPNTQLSSEPLGKTYLTDENINTPLEIQDLLEFERVYYRKSQKAFGEQTKIVKKDVRLPKYLIG